MAKNNMNFNATLRLTSDQFKKGVKDVQKSLDSLKRSFLSVAGALGAGLGFTQLISNLKDTAVQLSVAKSTLENVSRVTKTYTDGVNKMDVSISNYKENLAFVKNLSKEYSQDLVAITENFAQFHAACEKTNLDLENQKLVFESLTKAAAYYHMSSDRTKDMMTAITQMMSKGKVAAEELRRQLGNALPGAFNLMASALGVSTAQLDDMMKKGQVLASDALPRFAAMLNTVTKDADFDSLQLSLNRLKNSWYELVDNSGAEGMFNNLVDLADRTLHSISNNIHTIGDLIKGLVAGILSYKLFDAIQKRGNAYFANLESQLERVQKETKKTLTTLMNNARGTDAGPSVRFDPLTGGAKAGTSASKQEIANIIKYNDALIQTARIKKEVHGISMMSDEDLAKLTAYNNKLKGLNNTTVGLGAKLKGIGKTLTGAFKSIAMQVEGILMSMGAMAVVSAIIGGLTAIISHVKRIREEWEKINNIYTDYQKEVAKTDENIAATEKRLRSYLSILSDTTNTEKERLGALKALNKEMGTTFGSDALDKTQQAYKDIVAEVNRWVEATKLQAKIQVQARKGAEAEALIAEKEANIKANQAKMDSFKWWDQQGREHKGVDPNSWADRIEYNRLKREIDMDTAAIKELRKVVNDADKALDDLGVSLFDLYDEGNNGGGGGGGKAKGIAEVFEKFTKDKEELANKLREHAITQEEFNSELDKLVVKYWESAAATGQLSIDKILDKMDKGKTLTKMEKWYKDLRDAAEEAAQRVLLDGAGEAIAKELESALDREFKEFEKEMEDWAEKADKNSQADIENLLMDKPTKGKRDRTFDYKKSSSDIFGEEADVTKQYAEEIKAQIDEIVGKYDNIKDASDAVQQKLAKLRAEYALAAKEAASLEEAMKIRKIIEDIDSLNKEIDKAVLGGIKNFAQSTDRIVKGMETLKNTLEDTDASGWEKFMAVFNQIVQIIETFASLAETLNTIEDATQKLTGAELALEQQKLTLLEKEIALREAIRNQKAAETAQTEKAIAVDAAEAAVSKQAASANAGEAIAGATASGAKLAFPYNLIAIAAGVAAVIAALASMSKFANGGIIGGSSYSGDKQVARVNSGEMILNKHQQGMLFNAINSGKLGGGNVKFKIRGTDLIGVIDNEHSRRRG